MGSEPIPLLELSDDKNINFKDPYTRFNYCSENPNEEEYFSFTEITGIVRKGEKQDILHRRRNWKNEGVYTYIDLPFMSNFNRLFNIDGASTAYIERVVPSFESKEGGEEGGEEEETLYPVPANVDNFDRPVVTPNRHLEYCVFWGGSSVLSLLTLLTFFKR